MNPRAHDLRRIAEDLFLRAQRGEFGGQFSEARTVMRVYAMNLHGAADEIDDLAERSRAPTRREIEGRRFSLRRWLARLLRPGVPA